jgi:transcriptional regulator with XRE-family HTH domain
MSIGVKIRQLREIKKLSQNELAYQLGISQTTKILLMKTSC